MPDPANSIAILAGDIVVHGTLTNFVAAENDVFVAGGAVGLIQSRDSTKQITLKQPWAGPSLSGVTQYNILSLGEFWRSAITINSRFAALLAKWEIATPFKFDAAGTLADRDQYNNQPKGFTYLATYPLPVQFYIKLANTNSASDWSAGITIGVSQADYQQSLAQERTERLGGDAGLGQRIDGVVASIDPNLRRDLNAEVTRATGIEGGLRTDLTSEVNRAKGIEGGLRTDLTAESAAARAAETALDQRFTAAVQAETTGRLAGDAAFDQRLTPFEGFIGAFALSTLAGRNGRRVTYAFGRDTAGYTGFGVSEEDGIAEYSDLREYLPPQGVRNASRARLPIYPDRRGLSAIALDEAGEAEVVFSADGGRRAAEAITASPSLVRGTHQIVGAVTETRKQRLFSVRDRDVVLPVAQLRQGASTYAVPPPGSRVLMMLTVGQSNSADGSGEVPSPITDALFPYQNFEFIGRDVYGDAALVPAAYSEIRPARDDVYGVSPRTAMLNAFAQRARDLGMPYAGSLSGTSWRGGTTIDWFLPGAVTGSGRPNGLIYNNTTAMIDAMVEQANRFGWSDRYGYTIVPLVNFIQGENQSTSWKANANTLFNALASYWYSKIGTYPTFLVSQTNSDDTNAPNGNELDQWALSLERSDTILLGPMHPYRFHAEATQTGNDIHLANIGRLERGECDAYALAEYLRTGAWKSTSPTATTAGRSGTTVTINWYAPGGALCWDEDRVPAPSYGYRGFTATRVSDGANIPVSFVGLYGGTTLVTLASDPGGPVDINIGRGTDTVQDEWASARNTLYSPLGVRSFYARTGLPVWRELRAYAINCRVRTTS